MLPLMSGGLDSNQRPLAPHTSALPGCATTRNGVANVRMIPIQTTQNLSPQISDRHSSPDHPITNQPLNI